MKTQNKASESNIRKMDKSPIYSTQTQQVVISILENTKKKNNMYWF